MGLGPVEIGLVLLIALLLFGAEKLPGLGRGLGGGLREFKEGITGESEQRGHLSGRSGRAD